MAVAKPGGRPPKKTLAKANPKGKVGLTTTRKRSPSATNRSERASKIQKIVPKANSGKRVNGRGASVTDAFIISDDDDDFDQPRQESRTGSLSPPHQLLKIDTPSSDDDLNPTPTHNDLQSEVVRMKVGHSQELEQLRQQLRTSEARVQRIKEDAEREALELQHRQSVTGDKQMADLEDDLKAEQRRSSDLSWECDHLRREMEATRSCLKDEANLLQERDEYERLYKEEQDTNVDLMRELIEKDEEWTFKATEMAKEVQSLVKQTEHLQREVSRLKDENAALKASSSSQAIERRSSASPAPSQSISATDQKQRLANMRKTYITVKKRYDNLHSVATNMSTATRSWDYGSFGEFGQYLRQLKNALDENGLEERDEV